MTPLEVAARAWAAAYAALEEARRARDAADQAYADAVARAFDTARSAADLARDGAVIRARNEAAQQVRETGKREALAHLALLIAARGLR